MQHALFCRAARFCAWSREGSWSSKCFGAKIRIREWIGLLNVAVRNHRVRRKDCWKSGEPRIQTTRVADRNKQYCCD